MNDLLSKVVPEAQRFYTVVGNELHLAVTATMYSLEEELREWAQDIIKRDCPELEYVRADNGPARKIGDDLDRKEVNMVFVFAEPVTLAQINAREAGAFRTTLGNLRKAA